MCTATTVMVLSSMDTLGQAGGADNDYGNDDGASLAKGGVECAEANGPSVNGRWQCRRGAEAPADRDNQPEDERDAARNGGGAVTV
jgi:hypothetical protein